MRYKLREVDKNSFEKQFAVFCLMENTVTIDILEAGKLSPYYI